MLFNYAGHKMPIFTRDDLEKRSKEELVEMCAILLTNYEKAIEQRASMKAMYLLRRPTVKKQKEYQRMMSLQKHFTPHV